MTKPYLSIVIPYYNAPDNLERLIASIQKSKGAPPYEVIVVDDGSEEELKVKSEKLKVIRLKKNRGPAVARNRGVAVARGKFVVFLDSDVEVFADTLANIASVFRDDPDVVALTGVWVKDQRSRSFFPNFKALRDWSYWINERDKSGYYFLFSTRIAAIKRSVFLRLGGFDETYPAPLVEDIELTYRIARRYAIIFAPHVRVRHEFEEFWPIAKKYFLRAYYWTKLYQKRKKFDPVATTWQEAITTISGVGVVAMGLMSLIGPIRQICFMGLLGAAVVHIFLVRKFLAFVYREKGLVFAVKSFFVGLLLYCFIFAGAAWGRVR
ncbi:glycosyltransferase [Patescibacteria group bacterium]|nr:glycosyltransferase [Patescibacteria group bacterium]MBU1472909.1 glycosyltransferase [Patescibacteria group bacterium]MBU2460319.1 glycosyltransferase [Patescibacteria group bacterium]